MSVKLEECIQRILGGKMEGLVTEFKRVIIPEIQAVTEELRERTEEMETKEEVEVNENEVMAMNNELKAELEILRKEKDLHDEHLKNAATTKVRELVQLQNLLDHMRNDNRVLQHQLNRYRERFAEFKEAQSDNVVHKIWGFWQQRPRNHLST